MVWPAIMLANRRTDRLTGRVRYDRISIGTSRTSSTLGTPCGTNNVRKCAPCRMTPSTVTRMNTVSASAKVTMMWLVKVKEYGIMPSRLPSRMNMNSVNTNGTNLRASCPALSRTMPATNS